MHFPEKQQRLSLHQGGRMNRFGHPQSQEDLIGMRGVSQGLVENSRHVRPAVFLIRDTGGSYSPKSSFKSLHVTFCNVLPTYTQLSYSFRGICIMLKTYTIRL
ncbi:hypothetical protein CEXT_62121 [Caerostris extrusa]|uniref:Uncharacterized protein n=1 Tax=Caerostris extrusa TaxID=172846 RepID=A0AAV4RD78_CAEEX|nr:hypothetical protein CEXT_62121 [Caerostris extrusa]